MATSQSTSPTRSPAPAPSPRLLGLGNGVRVTRLDRGGCGGGSPYRSPWAVKRRDNSSRGGCGPRLRVEAAVLAGLSHPGIVGYRGLADGGSALVMQYGGESLTQRIERRRLAGLGPFPAAFVASALRQAAGALDYLHRDRRLLHGDVKSANLLLLPVGVQDGGDGGCGGRLRLCDFGSVVPLGEDLVAESGAQFRGTELWAAPEVLDDNRLTHKADMWSLGLVAYELLTLSLPHADLFEELGANDDDDALSPAGCLTDWLDRDYLVCERLGTRPELPAGLAESAEYREVARLYGLLTMPDPDDRLSAKELLDRLGPPPS